jgi:S-adenosylmethionine:diacylglycerol 3-amino-3-carboxypropyl transferase
METSARSVDTAWAAGRLDAREGPSRLLFGHMHEDSAIETAAFRPGGRVFCIASAGCTAMELSRRHEVVAVDINSVQVDYAASRFTGGRSRRGAAERVMGFWRVFAPAAGWTRSRVTEFLDLDDPLEQLAYWRRHLDTARFRAAMDLILSRPLLEEVYGKPFLRRLPSDFGRVMRGRFERGFARHPNRRNPYARALLLGEHEDGPPPPEARTILLAHSDAAAFLEKEPAGTFDGFALSNILDGAGDGYASRLLAAVRRAAAPGAAIVLRSFSEPDDPPGAGLAGEDRAMLWGIVQVKPASAL